MKQTIPLLPSVLFQYIRKGGRVLHNTRVHITVKPLSRQTRNFRTKFDKYQQVIRNELKVYKRGGPLFLRVKFYFRGPCAIDLDNMLVPLFNILEGVWFYDDRQIKALHAEVVENNHRYGVWMEIGHLKFPR